VLGLWHSLEIFFHLEAASKRWYNKACCPQRKMKPSIFLDLASKEKWLGGIKPEKQPLLLYIFSVKFLLCYEHKNEVLCIPHFRK
jgi:hypothetical protein